MKRPTKTGSLSRKNSVNSFLLSLILIVSIVSSVLLLGSTVTSQQAWATHLAAPVLESPTNGQVTNDNTPSFNWADVSTATGYSLQVDNNNDFLSLTYSATTSNSFQNNAGPAGGFPDGNYFWRVASRSSVADGFGSFSSPFSFTVDTADPPAPVLISPLNNAFTNDQTPTFDWNDVSDPGGINRYTLEVATTSSFGATTFLTQQITTGSPPPSEFTPSSNLNGGLEGTYFWHVRARDGFNQQGVFSGTRSFTIDITTPGAVTADKATGTYGPGLQVTLTPPEASATLYYKTNGDDPTPQSPGTEYTGPISIPNLPTPTTLKAIAKDAAGNFGPILTRIYTIDSTGPTVTADPTSTAFGPLGLDVDLNSDDTDLASIFYTTDGTDPDTSATRTEYTGTIHLTVTTTLKFIGYDNFDNKGTPGEETYTLDTTGPTVTADPTSTAFGPLGLDVDLNSDDTDLASIFYTTDGTDPDTSATRTEYTGTIHLTVTTTLKFIGYDNFDNKGTPGEETYTLDTTGPTVTADPTSTAFGPLGLDVDLNSDDTDLASIFYTTDGTDPDTSATRTEYTGTIHLTVTTTLKFIGYDNFDNKGTPGEETYTLDTTGPTVTADPTSTAFGPLGLDVDLNSDDTDLASIFYTTDGTDPDTSATRTEYTGTIHLTVTTTLKFIGYDNFDNKGTPGEETYTLDTTGPTVTADPTSTAFGPLGLDVDLNSDDTDLASIFYTTDGTDPDTSATRTEYTGTIHLTVTTTLKFIGYDNFDNKGTPGEETYTLDTTGPTVTADPTSTAFGPLGLDVDLNSDDTDLASIFYTTDGTDPDTSATRTEYTGTIHLTVTTTLKFIGYDNFDNKGTPGEETYTLDTTGPTVTASPTTGTFGPLGTSVTLSSAVASDTIFYTTDGTDPDTSATRTQYTAAISITSTTTLKFIGYDTFENAGTPGEETYTIDSTGPTVTASPTGGTYGAAQSVTLSSAVASDSIFYTTDGSTPDDGDTEYTAAISITSTTTLKFIGYDTFGNAGPVGTETYTIETSTTTDTSMSLQLSANKATPGATFTASGKLIDALADSPIAGQSITFTIDGISVGSPVTTDSKGQFSIQLTAPTTIGVHEIQAHFAGVDEQYNPSDSPVRNLKVEGAAPADTSLSLKLSKDKVNAGSSFSASGTLINEVTKKPIAGMTISVTGGLTTQTGITDSKGKYDIQLTAPGANGDHNIQAHFAGNSQYKSSDSPINKITVQGGTNLALATTSAIDTSLSLKIDGKDKMAAGTEYSVSGKLIDSVSKKPISGKEVSVKTEGDSSQGTDTTNSKGEFKVDLKAPDSPGKYDIKAHFDADSQYKSSDSSVKITVEETKATNQKTTVTTNQPNTDEQQTDEQQTDEQQTDEQQTDEQQTDEQQTDEQPEEEPEEDPTS